MMMSNRVVGGVVTPGVTYLESGSQWILDGVAWPYALTQNSWYINNGSTLTIGGSGTGLPTRLPYILTIAGGDSGAGKVVISDAGVYRNNGDWLWKTDVDIYGGIKSIGTMSTTEWRWAAGKTFRFFAGCVIDMHQLSFGDNLGNGPAIVKFTGAGSVILQWTTKSLPTYYDMKINIQSSYGLGLRRVPITIEAETTLEFRTTATFNDFNSLGNLTVYGNISVSDTVGFKVDSFIYSHFKPGSFLYLNGTSTSFTARQTHFYGAVIQTRGGSQLIGYDTSAITFWNGTILDGVSLTCQLIDCIRIAGNTSLTSLPSRLLSGGFGDKMVISSGGVLKLTSTSFDFQSRIRVEVGGRVEIGDINAIVTGSTTFGNLRLSGGSLMYTGNDGGQGLVVLGANGQISGDVSATTVGEGYISNILVQLNSSSASIKTTVTTARLVVIANSTFTGVGLIDIGGNE
jgi:hypothetical protein